MTTTVGIAVKDGVVLATDKRVTAGYYIAHKRGEKIWKIDDHVAATMSGGVADLQSVLSFLTLRAHEYKIEYKRPIPISALVNYMSLILFYSRPYIYIVHSIIGGVDEEEGAVLYMVDWLGTVTKEKYIATGSGSPYAKGALEVGYREDMTLEDAVDLAIKAVKAAIRNDPGSGEGIDVVVITRKEGFKRVFTTQQKLVLPSL
ncbi:archaeal proteasome endopeptidase complex subunit beta [Pyrobaculum aerophilum]|uniref:Proteasome subunit beta 1 n=2 Tax=Pyrobaculum aerophilum TaxID=13773 RepID=PSB1_PYRAE|nr:MULTISPECIES: archaeal proteasome endopeptidase complex subunit beta [Pyrobaculum]Q8ZYF2.1 RecName: Full=Proteasome subunit beta 1; AltName: Full=20S proteasome beta subunit 1; AltName: Full=Proteasome core protein PsmB 1; Flags: Precursor [Pyrobaculum aerophilum str. IM2]AAL63041.1 proteasome beta subunit [Pyrobaculum aerophilum str. IM2]MCX8136238.1 archaeal proteasome endopeptidase complex subunit beta [Pyrobaculum aerophilum]HII48186.1 archaeal proteasome endopeptidase complex subunit be